MRRVRSNSVIAALLLPFIFSTVHSADADTGSIQPLQLADGTKAWRYSLRVIRHEQAEASLNDLIAQTLGDIRWCEKGWEITSKTEPVRGVWLIEGRCK